MWSNGPRLRVARDAIVPDYDRHLMAALTASKSPRLWCGPALSAPAHGWGSVHITVLGAARTDLAWLESAVAALGGRVLFTSIQPLSRAAGRAERRSLADAAGRVTALDDYDASQPRATHELRRIAVELTQIRARGLASDRQLVRRYVEHDSIDHAVVAERTIDRQRFEQLVDEYRLMYGAEPPTWEG